MNRAVASFLTFCIALLILFAAVAWWLGLPLMQLAFSAEQRDAPYHVIYLANNSAPSAAPSAADLAYQQGFSELLASATVGVLWRANRVSVAAGEVADEWQEITALRYDSGSGFVRLVTSGGYRQLLAAAPGGRRSAFGLTQPPIQAVPLPEMLMIAVAIENDESIRLLPAFQGALDAGGQVVWDAPMAVLEGDARFNRLLVLGFTNAQTVDEWLWSAETETTLALLRAGVGGMRIWRLGR